MQLSKKNTCLDRCITAFRVIRITLIINKVALNTIKEQIQTDDIAVQSYSLNIHICNQFIQNQYLR